MERRRTLGSEVAEMGKEWRLIAKRTISEETSRIDITTDDDGKPFECNELVVMAKLRGNQKGVKPT